jgi:hypothetical protein
VQAHVVTPPVATMGEDPEPVRQEPTEPVVEHKKELQQPPLEDVPEVEAQNVPENEALRRSKELKNQLFLLIIKFIIQKQFIWKVIPFHMKKS